MPTLVIAALAAGAIILIALGIAMSGNSGVTLERLERYASTAKPEGPAGQGGVAELIAKSAALANLNKAVEKRDFGANLLRDLGAADLKLKPSEYLAIWAGTAIGVPVVMFLVGFVMPSLQNPIVLLLGLLIGAWVPRFWLNFRKGGRLKAFNKQLPDTVTLIANALRAGSSFLQAIELVVRESRPPISTEFGRVIREVNLGLPFDLALENMVKRVKSEDFELMATAIAIQHQVGGNLAEILDSIAFTIRERIRIKGEIRTLTAQQRLSGYVVGFLPFGLAFFIYLAAPTFFSPMFAKPPELIGIPAGIWLLGIAVLAMGAGFMFIRKIVDIEV
ncbi:MAG TPA: type II secretion system F family protein [Candidatus Limnocylindrales bacterium]|jgi:tight adherence protein B|nr:type II secretion system F family protein [Candidatus Limnocylindrales bacterium]